MSGQWFLPLGSGAAQNEPIGNKARLLDRAARRRLPVPRGLIVTETYLAHLLQTGLVAEAGDQLIAPDRAHLHAQVARDLSSQLPAGFVAVRSAFAAEDRPDASLAGFFHSVLWVDSDDIASLCRALLAVWNSASRQPGRFRRDVLIMQMVEAAHAGVAFSESAYADDLVNYTGGTADKLVGGKVAGVEMWLERLQRGEMAMRRGEETPFAGRLRGLLRHIRAVFGNEEWDIEWADDGHTCWLVQIRPITRPPRRNEAFTYANIREIMPDPPSPFMTSIVAACAQQLFAYYRQFDPGLPTTRPIIEIFAGRPLFNMTLLSDMMRRWGLPTQLVTGSIGGSAYQEAGFHPTRFLSSTIPLLKQGWAQLTAVASAGRATKQVMAIAADPGDTFTAAIENLTDLFALLVTEMFNLTAALSLPLLILRRSGTLAAHNARHHAISTAMYTDLAPLRAYVQQNQRLCEELQAGSAPADPQFQTMWQAYLKKHGHRGVYESDIARPRYHEDPAPLLQSLIHPAPSKSAPPPLTLSARLLSPVWWQTRRVLSAREWWRYNAMIAYDALRGRLLALATAAVRDGRLPSTDALWLLDAADVKALDDGACFTAADIVLREQALAAHREIEMPDLIKRFDDWAAGDTEPGAIDGRYRGISLTDGVVEGQAWVLREPATALPAGFDPPRTILVARSVDAGWIPTFALVAGVVVEIGGDLSHGSIILREIGLPAITNAPGAARGIETGDQVRLDAGSGVVRQLSGA